MRQDWLVGFPNRSGLFLAQSGQSLGTVLAGPVQTVGLSAERQTVAGGAGEARLCRAFG